MTALLEYFKLKNVFLNLNNYQSGEVNWSTGG